MVGESSVNEEGGQEAEGGRRESTPDSSLDDQINKGSLRTAAPWKSLRP